MNLGEQKMSNVEVENLLLSMFARDRNYVKTLMERAEIKTPLHEIMNGLMERFPEPEDPDEPCVEDGFYVPRTDTFYYGAIPENCTREQLVEVMAKGVVKFYEHEKLCTGKAPKLRKVVEIVDAWFEHEDFEELVSEDEYEAFEKEVLARARSIRAERTGETNSEVEQKKNKKRDKKNRETKKLKK